jgi:hypothetical protein
LAEERRGDVASVSDTASVRFETVEDMRVEHITLPVDDLSPLSDALIIFYHYAASRSILHILGSLTYDEAINEKQPLLVDVMQRRSRAFFPPYENPAPSSKPSLFYWPIRFHEPDEYVAFLAAAPFKREDAMEYMAWLRQKSPLPPSHSLVAARMFARHVGWQIQDSHPRFETAKFRLRYEQIRTTRESGLLAQQLEQFKTEDDLIQLFAHNHLRHALQAQTGDFIVDGTPLDKRCFYERHGKTEQGAYEPTIYFNVPMEEYPFPNILPVYEGGRVHVPCFWKDVIPWLMCKYEIQHHVEFYTRPVGVKPPVNEWIRDECRWMVRYLRTEDGGGRAVFKGERFAGHMTREGVLIIRGSGGGTGGAGAKRERSKMTEIDANHGENVADMEDFWSLQPPCFLQLRENKRFPKHMERLRWIPSLWEAGIAADTILNVLEDLHLRYPNSGGGQKLQQRFDAEALIKAGQGPTWCKNIITTTLQAQANENVIRCPFVKANKEEGEGDVYARCMGACSGGSRTQKLAPHLLIRNKLNARRLHVKIETEEKDGEKEDDDDEESDDKDGGKRGRIKISF